MNACFRRTLAPIVATAGLLLAGGAAAQQPSAREADRRAREAFDARDFSGAARAFAEAYAVAPLAATKYNEALAWDKAGEVTRAADAFVLALELGGLDADRQRAAEERLATLVRVVGSVLVTCPLNGTVSVEQATNVPVPAKVHLRPGQHTLTVQWLDGTRATHVLDVSAGARLVVGPDVCSKLAAPRAAIPPPPRAAVPLGSMTTARASTPPPPPPPPPRDARWTAGWIAAGGAAVLSGVAVGLGLETLSARDEFVDSGRLDPDPRDRAVTMRTLTNVVWVSAAVTGVVATVLLVTARSGGSVKQARSSPGTALRYAPLR